jgi:hypothetical protein
VKRDELQIVVYTESYFDGKIEVDSLDECKKLIHKNHLNSVRVQIGSYRLLLHPSKDGVTRKIDGFSDLSKTYELFNCPPWLSTVTVDEKGRPGGVYVSNIK